MSVKDLHPKAYRRTSDLKRAQAALMSWVSRAGHCNYLHKGDIGHRLFNNCYGYDKADVFHYWTDDKGEVVAFAIFCPPWDMLDLQVAPSLFGSEAHAELISYCEGAALKLSETHSKTIKQLVIEVDACAPSYPAFVEGCGYTHSNHSFTMTRHNFTHLPDAQLPAGFHFHDASFEDAERMADVHNHSFTNKWSAESYGEVFRSPHLEYEMVVVAPDGRFAAFTNVWIDDLNRSLLFEPVGTHLDFRRRGIAKALMVSVLKRMKAQHELLCAYVCHEPADKNPASTALYASVGFQKLHEIHVYVKPMA